MFFELENIENDYMNGKRGIAHLSGADKETGFPTLKGGERLWEKKSLFGKRRI